MKKWFSRIGSAVLTIGWMMLIFGFSGQNSEESEGLSARIVNWLLSVFTKEPVSENVKDTLTLLVRKGAHMTEFAILALLLLWAVVSWTKLRGRKAFLAAFLIAVAFASTDEIHQTFVDGRAGRVSDVIIDSCGALCGLLLCSLIMRCKKVAEKSSDNSSGMDN